MIAIGMTPLHGTAPFQFQIMRGLTRLANGDVTVQFEDNTVLSVQPDGSYQHRVPGTAGAYEVARVDGPNLVYCPDGRQVYVIPYLARVPNR